MKIQVQQLKEDVHHLDFVQVAHKKLSNQYSDKTTIEKREIYRKCGLLFRFSRKETRFLLKEFVTRFSWQIKGKLILLPESKGGR